MGVTMDTLKQSKCLCECKALIFLLVAGGFVLIRSWCCLCFSCPSHLLLKHYGSWMHYVEGHCEFLCCDKATSFQPASIYECACLSIVGGQVFAVENYLCRTDNEDRNKSEGEIPDDLQHPWLVCISCELECQMDLTEGNTSLECTENQYCEQKRLLKMCGKRI